MSEKNLITVQYNINGEIDIYTCNTLDLLRSLKNPYLYAFYETFGDNNGTKLFLYHYIICFENNSVHNLDEGANKMDSFLFALRSLVSVLTLHYQKRIENKEIATYRLGSINEVFFNDFVYKLKNTTWVAKAIHIAGLHNIPWVATYLRESIYYRSKYISTASKYSDINKEQ